MQDTVINVLTKKIEKVNITSEEIARREAERLAWEAEQAKPKPPTEIDYLLDLDYRLSMIELGL
jgi:hypothetical protein